MDANSIYPVKWENDTFESQQELQWYLKYLFSCSIEYPVNEGTQFNAYLRQDLNSKKLSKFGMLNQNKEKYQQFKNQFYTYFLNEKLTSYDTYHIGYFITIGSKIITNLVGFSDTDSNVLITKIPNSLLDRIIDDFFDGNEASFFKKMEAVLNDSNKQIISLKDASLDERKIVEKRIHGTLNFNESQQILLSISHHDEDKLPYHIHRLISEQKE